MCDEKGKVILKYGFILLLFFNVPAFSLGFEIFNGVIGYKDGLPSNLIGMKSIKVVYGEELWGPRKSADPNVPWPSQEITVEDENRIRQLAKTYNDQKLNLICLDIEHWPLHGSNETVQDSINKFAKVIGWIREEAPLVKIGIFGRPPVHDFPSSIQPHDSIVYKTWVIENKRLTLLANLVDVIFPSLYTSTIDPKKWEIFAIESLEQSKYYKKPVYAFIWSRFEGPKNLNWTYLPQTYWEMELQVVKNHSDGVVIWDYGEHKVWNDQSAWWQFIKSSFLR